MMLATMAPAQALDGRSTVSFTVRDGAGHPVPGARVLLGVMNTGGPSAGAASTKGVGGEGAAADAARVTLGSRRAQSGADGRVSVAFAPTADERAAAAANGDWLNVQAMLIDSAGLPAGYTSRSLYLGSEPSQIAEAAALASSAPDLSVSDSIRDSARSAGGRSANAPLAVTAGVSPMDECNNYRWVDSAYPWAWVKVGEIHAATDVKDHYFGYGNHADSNIEYGIRGSSGVVTILGSIHIGNSMDSIDRMHTNGASNQHWNVYAGFNFVTGSLYADCASTGWKPKFMGQTQTQPTSHDDSYGLSESIIISQPTRKSANTKTVFANGGFTRTKTSLAKFSGAVSVGGLSLGAQSGASTYVQISYTMGSAESQHYIYGEDGLPTVSGHVYETNK